MLFLDDDWEEAHHDVELQDPHGKVLARHRPPEGMSGLAQLHALIADYLDEDDDRGVVVVEIEADRAGGCRRLSLPAIWSIRLTRHVSQIPATALDVGAKSDPGDAHVLAEIVRTDRDHHRPAAGDSDLAEAVKALARTHQTMTWSQQRQANQWRSRSMLRELYPAALAVFGDDPAGRDALAVLAVAATPRPGGRDSGRAISVLRRAGRRRHLDKRAAEITAALRADHSNCPPRSLQRAARGDRDRGRASDDDQSDRRAGDIGGVAFWPTPGGTSPGARAFYDAGRARNGTHHEALRALSNRLVGILGGLPPSPRRSNEERPSCPARDTVHARASPPASRPSRGRN